MELTTSRLVAIALALVYVVAFLVVGAAHKPTPGLLVGAAIVGAITLLPLSMICAPWLWSQGGGRFRETPESAVVVAGWVVLLAPAGLLAYRGIAGG